MFEKILNHAVLAVLCICLMACKNDYKIEAPESNSVHTSAPTLFKISYEKQPDELPKMTLNGFNIESYFVAGATEATANGADFSDYLIEGYNSFQVKPPLGPILKFIYDTEGPQIVILSAELDDMATITGLAVDELGVTSLSVNGNNIAVNEAGTFTTVVTPADIYTYNATDTLGHTKTTQYASLGLEYDPSLTIKVTQEGLDIAMDQVVNALNVMDINSLVAGTMLYDSTWLGLFGETYGADGFIRTLTISASEFNLDLADGARAAFDGTITHSHVELTLRMHNGFLPATEIKIGAEVGTLNLDGNLDFSVENNVPKVNISDFSFNAGAVVIDDVGVVFQAILSGVTTGILNVFNGVISDAVEGALNDAIPDLLAKVIKESYTISIADAVDTHEMAMALKLENIVTTEASLYAGLSGGVIPINPDLDIPQPLAGTLYTADALPEANLGEGDFAISLNTNAINQTLASAHAVGLTQMNIVGEEIQFGIPRDDTLGGAAVEKRILVDSMTPSTVQVSDVAGDAAIKLSIYGLEVSSQSKLEDGSFRNDLSVRTNAKVALAIGVKADNTLDILFPSVPEVIITGIRIGEGEWISDAVNEVADGLIAGAFGQILVELAKPLMNIQIPAFECLAFTPDNVTAVGGNNSHLNIAGTLTKIDDTCDNLIIDPPKVAYGRGVGTPMTCSSDEEYDAGLCYEQCAENYNGVGPVCWREEASYGRGVGTIPYLCAAGEENDAGLCYPVCNAGYNGVGPVCWNERPLSYGRGVGTIPSNIWTGECPSGKENNAGLCYWYCDEGYTGVGPVCWLNNASYGRGVGTIPKTCAAGEEKDAGLCYPVCNDGYHGVGPVCWTNDALSYGRGVGSPIHTCLDGKEQDAGLCYDVCDEGYNGIGPVCWPIE